jgi:hypothetical protein
LRSVETRRARELLSSDRMESMSPYSQVVCQKLPLRMFFFYFPTENLRCICWNSLCFFICINCSVWSFPYIVCWVSCQKFWVEVKKHGFPLLSFVMP